MNAKQSLRLVVKENERLTDFNRRAALEIKALNVCIDSVIAGEKTYCDWCEDRQECQRECKGSGCSEWWLMIDHGVKLGEEVQDGDICEGVLPASTPC